LENQIKVMKGRDFKDAMFETFLCHRQQNSLN